MSEPEIKLLRVMWGQQSRHIWSAVWHHCPDSKLILCLWPLTPCRSGALQPRARVWEGLVPPAASPQRQPGSALWPKQPPERGSLSVHPKPPGGLFHPAAPGMCSRHSFGQRAIRFLSNSKRLKWGCSSVLWYDISVIKIYFHIKFISVWKT